MQKILNFLTEIKQNNNREWFEQNKQQYAEVKKEHEQLLEQVIEGISRFDAVTGRPAVKDCLFRIYRDVRFSSNKDPYKTHLGAFIARGGRKSERPGFYLHIEPGNSMVGGGIYMPEPPVLKKIRDEIYFDAPALRSILDNKDFKKHFAGLYEDKLTRPPKGYDADFADADLLKYKSYFVEKKFTDQEVTSPNFAAQVTKTCEAMMPMQVFLNRAFND